jgi:flagellar motor switch protein FliG
MTTISQQTMGFRRRIDKNSGSAVNRPHGEGPAASPSLTGASRPSAENAISPLRKAAIVLVSLEQSSASHLLSHLDRAAVEAVTWEIARIDRIDPDEQEMVLEEFFGLGLRRHYFGFDDILTMADDDIRRAYLAGDARTWALALASASPPLRAKVLDALTPTAAQSLRQTLQNLGPFRLADAEVAQTEIAERFRELSDQGVIVLPEPSGRDDLLA